MIQIRMPAVAGLLVVGLMLSGCPGGPPSEYSTQEIALSGLTCDMCVSKVEKAIAALDGIQSYAVDLEKKMASVQFDAAVLSVSDIEGAIAEAGFTANATTRNEEAHADLPGCCQSSESVDL